MTWSYRSEADRVYLDFKEYPNHFVSIESAELSDYLNGLPANEVEVHFEVVTRLGCVDRITATRIGERTDWTTSWGGSGWVGNEHPSPWDRFDCRVPWWSS